MKIFTFSFLQNCVAILLLVLASFNSLGLMADPAAPIAGQLYMENGVVVFRSPTLSVEANPNNSLEIAGLVAAVAVGQSGGLNITGNNGTVDEMTRKSLSKVEGEAIQRMGGGGLSLDGAGGDAFNFTFSPSGGGAGAGRPGRTFNINLGDQSGEYTPGATSDTTAASGSGTASGLSLTNNPTITGGTNFGAGEGNSLFSNAFPGGGLPGSPSASSPASASPFSLSSLLGNNSSPSASSMGALKTADYAQNLPMNVASNTFPTVMKNDFQGGGNPFLANLDDLMGGDSNTRTSGSSGREDPATSNVVSAGPASLSSIMGPPYMPVAPAPAPPTTVAALTPPAATDKTDAVPPAAPKTTPPGAGGTGANGGNGAAGGGGDVAGTVVPNAKAKGGNAIPTLEIAFNAQEYLDKRPGNLPCRDLPGELARIQSGVEFLTDKPVESDDLLRCVRSHPSDFIAPLQNTFENGCKPYLVKNNLKFTGWLGMPALPSFNSVAELAFFRRCVRLYSLVSYLKGANAQNNTLADEDEVPTGPKSAAVAPGTGAHAGRPTTTPPPTTK
jgi:hypothetical protein